MKKILLIIILLLLSGCKEEKEFLVTFDSSGGSIVMDVLVKEEDILNEPPEPSKDEYVFAGWYEDDNKYDFSIPVTKDVNLKAHWIKIETCNITCDIGYRIDDPSSKDCTCIKSNTPVVTSISINKNTLSLKVGEKEKLTATVSPSNVPFVEIKWSSSNNDIAVVDNGVVTGRKVGKAVITAYSGDVKTSITVYVTKDNKLGDYLLDLDVLITKLVKELNNNYGFGNVTKNDNNITTNIEDKLSIALNAPLIMKEYLNKIDKNITLEYVIILDNTTLYKGSNKELDLNSLLKTLRDIYHHLDKKENLLNIKIDLKQGKEKVTKEYNVTIVLN